jgi:phenylacetaldehyde dehydrogenase
MDLAQTTVEPGAAAKAFLERGGNRLLIGGAWAPGETGQTLDSVDPATGGRLAQIVRGSARDVDRAVAAARAAFEQGAWPALMPVERSRLLWRMADLIEQHIDELAELETLDQGKPLFVGRWAEIPGAVNQFRFFAGQAMTIEGATITPSINYQPAGKAVTAWTLREPVGVVAAIVPWNSPIVLTAMKLAPALAAGCTVVLKPAEDTSLTALRLGELFIEAGFPPGVVNIVTGLGAEVGAALAAHPGVDKVTFTGSTQTGRSILDAAKGNLKRVTLELGGKSPAIILPDADLDLAIPGTANGIFFNGGQVCVAGSRLYAHRSIYDRVVEGVAAYAQGLRLGHGLDPATQMGPVVSMRQAERIEGFISGAKSQGASVLTGGERTGAAGAFISPTVIAGVHADMEIVREEVFGPVVVVQAYDDVDEVVAAANDTVYGLAASVWTESLSSAHRLSRRIHAGTVWINCHLMYDASLPIGGMKQSGWGRESGAVAMENYLDWKTVCAVY